MRSQPRRERWREDLRCWWFVAETGMRSDRVAVVPPALDDDLSFPRRLDDLAVEQLIAQATSLTPIWRVAWAILCPCKISTSTCRSFATIFSGLYLFLVIAALPDVKTHTSSQATLTRADQSLSSPPSIAPCARRKPVAWRVSYEERIMPDN